MLLLPSISTKHEGHERKISFVSEVRRNRSDGNFDGTNNATGEYFLEEVHRKDCNQTRELNIEHFFCRHH